MKNFPVKIDNKEYWISRSVATAGLIFTNDKGLSILAVKRGKGCPDEVGKWCCPCGYLDWDETLKECCCREIREESNLQVLPEDLRFWYLNDDPKETHQNITAIFYCYNEDYIKQSINFKHSEPNEVEEVKWIKVSEIYKYDWAFNHLKLIQDCNEVVLKGYKFIW